MCFDELVKILDYKKRQSTNCEMKKSLQVIIDFIGDKNKTYHGNNLISSQTNLKLKYPTCNELTNYIIEEVGDCFMDCHNEEQKNVHCQYFIYGIILQPEPTYDK